MATLYIAEIGKLGVDIRGKDVMAPYMPPLVEQTVTIGMSHTESNPFTGSTVFVQIHCDAICSVAFGAAPIATASNQRLAANETRFVSVEPGSKLSVITNS